MLPSEQGKPLHAPVTETSDRRDGVGSSSETLAASDGPLFLTAIVKVTLEPGFADAGPLFVTEMSAFCVITTVAVELLLPGVGSFVVVETVAVLATVPDAFEAVEYVTAKVMLDPAVSVPMLQGATFTQPTGGVDVIETNVRKGGVGSLRTTFWASDGPLFVTLIV